MEKKAKSKKARSQRGGGFAVLADHLMSAESMLTKARAVVDARDAVVNASCQMAVVDPHGTGKPKTIVVDEDAWNEWTAAMNKLDVALRAQAGG